MIEKEQNKNVRNYLDKYWGYTTRMIDEVMATGQTPRKAEYLDDKILTTTQKKDNLRKYMMDNFQYTERQLDEIQETGKAPSLKYEDVKDEPVWNNPISPNHYQQGKIQVIDFITDQQFNWIEGNIVKYISRYKTKNGVEDLKKAQFYIKRLIDENS